MLASYVFHNDRLLPIEQVRLSPGQAGLLNGWGLFSTLRIIEGIPLATGQKEQRRKERNYWLSHRSLARNRAPVSADGVAEVVCQGMVGCCAT